MVLDFSFSVYVPVTTYGMRAYLYKPTEFIFHFQQKIEIVAFSNWEEHDTLKH